MITDLNQILTSIIFFLLIVLVTIFIILGIKLIKALKKVDVILTDTTEKLNKVNGVFNIIDKSTDYVVSVSDKIINGLSNFISSLFRKKKGNDEDE